MRMQKLTNTLSHVHDHAMFHVACPTVALVWRYCIATAGFALCAYFLQLFLALPGSAWAYVPSKEAVQNPPPPYCWLELDTSHPSSLAGADGKMSRVFTLHLEGIATASSPPRVVYTLHTPNSKKPAPTVGDPAFEGDTFLEDGVWKALITAWGSNIVDIYTSVVVDNPCSSDLALFAADCTGEKPPATDNHSNKQPITLYTHFQTNLRNRANASAKPQLSPTATVPEDWPFLRLVTLRNNGAAPVATNLSLALFLPEDEKHDGTISGFQFWLSDSLHGIKPVVPQKNAKMAQAPGPRSGSLLQGHIMTEDDPILNKKKDRADKRVTFIAALPGGSVSTTGRLYRNYALHSSSKAAFAFGAVVVVVCLGLVARARRRFRYA